MPWEVRPHKGIHLPQIGWWLDASRPVERSFVSHAHFDHLGTHREVLLTPGTAALMRARLPDKRGRRRERILDYCRPEPLSPDQADTTVTLLPAGHVRGSAMILLEHPERGRLLYTGDFKPDLGLGAEPCQSAPADVLIMETTYGLPRYVMPPAETVRADIVAFCRDTLAAGDTPVLFAYSLGKSQEVLLALADAGLPVQMPEPTFGLTRLHESLGLSFPAYSAFESESLPGHVLICPPHSPKSRFIQSLPRPRIAMISGWALDPGARYRFRCDAVFPLTDHADYPGLLRFVEAVKPRRVLTVHGFAAEFAADLRSRGVEAWALGQDNQLDLPLAGA